MRMELIQLHKKLNRHSYVTHDQIEAMTMGDNIVVMNEGKKRNMELLPNHNDPLCICCSIYW